MKTAILAAVVLLIGAMASRCGGGSGAAPATNPATSQPATAPIQDIHTNVDRADKIAKSAAEWKKQLTPEQFNILREKGTERAFTGATWDNHDKGIYKCAGCDLEVFSSDTKFESGTGWPSFWQPIAADRVHVALDDSHGMTRDEVTCARCEGHLGHVFEDGPKPTGLRYCMNSAAMKFEKAK
ncbi:MAG: peptide-methionine (R)-S-oxide reductase [Phycisphaerales bacterium]|jgi:peptide-methionine (R)-S-oxide reductase|nr:peptide-methionine (R)-S-oxide reductase [Phycisphaerales bacterium]